MTTIDPQEQQKIDDYKQVESFLAHPAVKRAFESVTKSIIEEFRASTSPEQRETLFAKQTALDSLATELLRTMAEGQFALRERQAREERETRERRLADRRTGKR